MDWTEQVDGYCERLDPSFWAEPINAITNFAFMIVAAFMFTRSRGVAMAQLLSVVLFLIGVGSFLFHTYAQPWAGVADVLPIVAYVLIYIFAATRDFYGQSPLRSGIATVLFFPYAAVLLPLIQFFPILNVSAAYVPVPLLIFLYALGLQKRSPETAKRLYIGATMILTSILVRSIDMPLCESLPMGTHFLWHLLNAVALGWMIETYHLHRLAPAQNQG